MAARAVLVPESRYRHDLFRTVLTDAKGEFEIPGIAPGKYKVFAWRYVPESAWLDPDFLVRFEEHGALVQVEENRKTGVEVRVAPR
jgi:hypothetical protein